MARIYSSLTTISSKPNFMIFGQLKSAQGFRDDDSLSYFVEFDANDTPFDGVG